MVEVGKKYKVARIDKKWDCYVPSLDKYLDREIIIAGITPSGDPYTGDGVEGWTFCEDWLEEVIEQEPQSALDTNDDFQSAFLSTPAVINHQDGPVTSDTVKLTGEQIADMVGKNVRVFESGSQRDDDTNKPLVNHLDPYLRIRVGYQLRSGANKYTKNNWRLGQDTETALESLHRHLAYYEKNHNDGVEQDEDHLAAIIFNVMLIMKNEEKAGICADKYFGTLK